MAKSFPKLLIIVTLRQFVFKFFRGKSYGIYKGRLFFHLHFLSKCSTLTGTNVNNAIKRREIRERREKKEKNMNASRNNRVAVVTAEVTTYMLCTLDVKSEPLLAGTVPWSLFLSSLSSSSFCKLPSSGGNSPVNPLDSRFLQNC